MGKTFRLDGRSHAVCPHDLILMEGPGQLTTKDGKVVDLRPRDTCTMTCERMVPGEAISITCGAGTTTFFVPWIERRDQREEARSKAALAAVAY